MVLEKDITIEFDNALIVSVGLPILLASEYRLHEVLADEVVIFEFEFDLIYRRNFEL